MDKVVLNRIELQGKIGILEEEKLESQRYWVSLSIGTDLKGAGESDRLEETIDYARVYEIAKTEMEQCDCDLIEGYAEGLAKRILSTFENAGWVTIEVLKPDAPIDGKFDSVGIQITRSRND